MLDMCKLIYGNIGYNGEDNDTNLYSLNYLNVLGVYPYELGWRFKRKTFLAYALIALKVGEVLTQVKQHRPF